MEIYLLRHGIAENSGPDGSDAGRRLTDEGRERLKAVLCRARAAGVSPGVVLSSPYVRAVQTAQAAADALGYKGKIVETRALVPESTPEAVWDEIRALRNESSILLASHEPLLGQVVSFLLGAPRVVVNMKKGALVRIDDDRVRGVPQGVLAWMVTPKIAGA